MSENQNEDQRPAEDDRIEGEDYGYDPPAGDDDFDDEDAPA